MAIFFQGRLDEAQSVFEASLAVRPDDPGAMNGMGAIAVERDDLDAAEDWFSRVLAQDPENELARKRAGRGSTPQAKAARTVLMQREISCVHKTHSKLGGVRARSRLLAVPLAGRSCLTRRVCRSASTRTR